MHARTTLSGTEAMLNNFADQVRSLKDPWEFDDDAGIANFDPEVLLGAIMLKGSNLQPVFTDPRQFYQMNRLWWLKWKPTFQSWCSVIEKEYEPLWDRNGYETIDDLTKEKGTLDSTTTGSEVVDDDTTGSKNSTEIMDDDTTGSRSVTSNSDTENTVSAYDATTYQPHDKSETDASSSESTSGTDDRTTTFSETTSGTDDRTTQTNGTVDTDTTGEKTYKHEFHSWGNWGISMTSQKLLEQELEVRYWNVYEHMSDIFLDEMTVRVF